MAYEKVETWITRGYTRTDEDKKLVSSSKCEAQNASSIINPSEIKAKVEEIKSLNETIANELKTKVDGCSEYAGSDTISVNGGNYKNNVTSIYTDFDLSGFAGELDACVSEAEEKFNESQKQNNENAKQESISECISRGGVYSQTPSLVTSKEAF